MGIAGPVRVLISMRVDVPSVLGWLRPVILLPPATMMGLTPQQLEGMLAHELAHVRRHDYLVNIVQTIAETLLFYHPAVWWMSRQIRHERELCCDDLAVQACGDPLCDARALTTLEKLRVAAPRLAMGSTSGPLLYRIQRLLGASRREYEPSHWLSVAAICLGLAFVGLDLNWVRAQSQTAVRPAFDVASVKPYQRSAGAPRNSPQYDAQGIHFGGVAVTTVIGEAYNIAYGHIVGAGSLTKESLWGSLSERYDIVAKAEHAVPKEQLRLMLQTLLADRFKLSAHLESKVQPVYKLVVGKNGPRLGESTAGGAFAAATTPEGLVFHDADMKRFVGFLGGQVDLPVVDRTGLKGSYNFTLKLERRASPTSDAGSKPKSSDACSSSVFTDIQKLGLKLEGDKAAVDYLVIDHVEKPTEN